MKHNAGANLSANFAAIGRALKLFFSFYPVLGLLHCGLESVLHQTGGGELPEVQQRVALVEVKAQALGR